MIYAAGCERIQRASSGHYTREYSIFNIYVHASDSIFRRRARFRSGLVSSWLSGRDFGARLRPFLKCSLAGVFGGRCVILLNMYLEKRVCVFIVYTRHTHELYSRAFILLFCWQIFNVCVSAHNQCGTATHQQLYIYLGDACCGGRCV